MTDNENIPLSRCKIELPELPKIRFMGCFEITDNNMSVWIEFEKSNCNSKTLFSYLDKNTNFPILLSDENEYGYSCFGCFSLEDCNFLSSNDYGLIKIYCSRWIDAFHVESEDEKFITKAYIKFPFLEYWFDDTEEEFRTNDYIVKPIKTKSINLDVYHCSNTQTRNCYFELIFPNRKTLKEVARIEESLWLFIRFVTNIPFPRASIRIENDEDAHKPRAYHFTSGPCFVISNYAKPTEYSNMPIRLGDIAKDKDIFSKWNKYLDRHYHAIKMWTKEMNKESFFDEKIAHYIQIIDGLTENIDIKPLKAKLQYCLDKYHLYISPEIKEDTAENLTKIRVAFSHFKNTSFIREESIDHKAYMNYEKIAQSLIRFIITENVFEKEIMERLKNPKYKP